SSTLSCLQSAQERESQRPHFALSLAAKQQAQMKPISSAPLHLLAVRFVDLLRGVRVQIAAIGQAVVAAEGGDGLLRRVVELAVGAERIAQRLQALLRSQRRVGGFQLAELEADHLRALL